MKFYEDNKIQMLKNIAALIVFSLFITAACARTPVEINAANNSVSEANPIAESPKSDNSGEKSAGKLIADNPNAKIFRGMINGISFEMRLVRDGDKLSGTYFYTKVRKDLKLAGTINAAGKFNLQETDAAGKKTGEWQGTWKEESNSNGIALEGNWKKPGDSDGNSFPFYAAQQIIEFSGDVKFVDKTIKETDKAKRSDISDVYPEITGVETVTAAKFNAAVKKIVTAANTNYKKEVAGFTAEDIKSLPSSIGLSNEVNYEIALANNEIVSLIFSNYSFMGGAHGGTSFTTLNYDLKNNRELKLEEMFEPNANYLKLISDYSIADLKPRIGDMSDDEWLSKGAAADAGNYQNWNLTKKGLMITFEQYQVAAYAAGSQQVIVPYDKLKSILRKDGVTANLAK